MNKMFYPFTPVYWCLSESTCQNLIIMFKKRCQISLRKLNFKKAKNCSQRNLIISTIAQHSAKVEETVHH